ncbi:haloacid dehalogenase type II [Lichenicoccus sp.]|uniref:haloacid dehalogenase type II n=1 Tax=Lichenicoccus sp. TaxID=2781899 RepID=UPI003D0B5440
MTSLTQPRAIVFDVIGTLFSLESQRGRLIDAGLPAHALESWFAASLRDLFALAVTRRTAPMIKVLEDNLHHLLARHHLRQDGPRVQAILAGMGELDVDPEAAAALDRFASQGLTCAALSNGSQAATERLLERGGIRMHFAEVLSIDTVGLPKPRAEVYRMMAEHLHLECGAILMIAAHPWDLHGARAAGLATGFLSRGLPWPTSLDAPDLSEVGLDLLARRVCAL